LQKAGFRRMGRAKRNPSTSGIGQATNIKPMSFGFALPILQESICSEIETRTSREYSPTIHLIHAAADYDKGTAIFFATMR